jgi:YbbR domain-containing protein
MNNSDTSLKVLALILAVFLWSYVRINVLKQPEVWRMVSGIPVVLINHKESNFQYQYPKFISVEMKGTADLLINLPPLTANIDVTDVVKKTSLPVKISGLPSNGIQVTKQSIEVIPVEIISKNIDVNIIFVPQLPQNVFVKEYIISPTKNLTVTGASEVVNSVKYLTASIDPIGNSANFTQEIKPVAIGINGEHLSQVSIIPETIRIKVKLAKK